MEKSREILKKYWGFDHFRPMQEEIVDDVIYGHDTLALLPTGGGKSICFQVPGIAREGLTVVISPLIALMQDQVDQLSRKGIRAKAIVSGMSYKEIDIILDNARFGAVDFLYTSPERIQSKLFIERFKQMNVGLIVVDEAHCISEWGHDFRPSFMEIKRLREIHPKVPVIAVTATATQPVKDEIISKLALKDVRIHEKSFVRDNLSYEVYKVENKVAKLLDFCKQQGNNTGIIYCQTRKAVKEIARLLIAHKFSVGIYHGGMSKKERDQMLTDWMLDRRHIMVATNAFGMGIDKPDVRFVLHAEFPFSLEAYFQEAGRAGRDGNEARAITFWENQDFELIEQRIHDQFPPVDIIKNTYRALCNYLKVAIGSGVEETYPLDLKDFCKHFNLNYIETYHSLKILELNGDISLSEGIFHPTRVKFSIGNTALYNFQVQHDKFLSLTQLLSRSYPGIFENYHVIDEDVVAKRLSISSPQLTELLKNLETYGVLDISWRTNLPTVTFLHERLPDDYLTIAYSSYKQRQEIALKKIEAVETFLFAHQCRSVQLLKYFGQEANKCGKCDVCRSENQKQISMQELKKDLLVILKNMQTLEDCVTKTNVNQETVTLALKALLLEEKIVSLDNKFIINQ